MTRIAPALNRTALDRDFRLEGEQLTRLVDGVRLGSLGMTTANKITILRTLLVPFFVAQVLYYVNRGVEWHRLAAILTFAVAAGSDALDGYIARHYNQRSQLGAILDPLADKLLLVAGVVLLSFDHRPFLPQTPLWLVGTIVGRDAIILLGVAAVHHTCGRVVIRPILLGKVATILQMACVLWGLFKWNQIGLELWSLAAAVCTAGSGCYYVYEGLRQFSASPAAGPTPEHHPASLP